MRIYIAYVTVTETVRNQQGQVVSGPSSMSKEFVTAGENINQAAERATWQARGYNALNPMITNVPTNTYKVVGTSVVKMNDIGYNCLIPGRAAY